MPEDDALKQFNIDWAKLGISRRTRTVLMEKIGKDKLSLLFYLLSDEVSWERSTSPEIKMRIELAEKTQRDLDCIEELDKTIKDKISEKIQRLKEEIKRYDEWNANHWKEFYKNKESVKTLTSENSELVEENYHLSKSKRRIEHENERLKKKVAKLDKEIQQLKKLNSDEKEESKFKSVKITELIKEKEALEAKVRDLTKKDKENKAKIDRQNKQIDILERLNKKFQENNDLLRESNKKLGELSGELQETKLETDREIKLMKERINKTDEKVSSLNWLLSSAVDLAPSGLMHRFRQLFQRSTPQQSSEIDDAANIFQRLKT